MPRWYMEEKGIAYDWRLLDMQAGEHKQEPFLSINPFGKLPALVHEDPAVPGGRLQLFESGAILLYLAELSGECSELIIRLRRVRSSRPPSAVKSKQNSKPCRLGAMPG